MLSEEQPLLRAPYRGTLLLSFDPPTSNCHLLAIWGPLKKLSAFLPCALTLARVLRGQCWSEGTGASAQFS